MTSAIDSKYPLTESEIDDALTALRPLYQYDKVPEEPGLKATVYYCKLSDDEIYGFYDWFCRERIKCSESIRSELKHAWTFFFSFDADSVVELNRMYESTATTTINKFAEPVTQRHLICQNIYDLLWGQFGNELLDLGYNPTLRKSFALKDGDVVRFSRQDGKYAYCILFKYWRRLKFSRRI
jgi:hypothetical protein